MKRIPAMAWRQENEKPSPFNIQGDTMPKPSVQVFFVGRIVCLSLLIGFATSGRADKVDALAEKIDAKLEQLRRDLLDYQQSAKELGAIAAEIHGLRDDVRQAQDREDGHLQRIEEELKLIKAVQPPAPSTNPLRRQALPLGFLRLPQPKPRTRFPCAAKVAISRICRRPWMR